MADKRMFEGDGKFWEIWLEAGQVYTRHGKLGSAGQTKLKQGDAALLEKMVKDKLADGYVQTGGEVAAGPALDKKELKRHLGNIKNIRDTDAISVLADWLQTQNHPWGELIALQTAEAKTPAKATSLRKQADKLIKENGPALLGEVAGAKHTSFDWQHGLIRGAQIGSPADPAAMVKAVKTLLALPAASFMDKLAICPYVASFATWRDWDASQEHIVDPWKDLDKLAAALPERITHVGLGGWPAPAASGYVTMPSFTKVSSLFKHVIGLDLTGWCGDKPGKLSLPNAKYVAIRFARAVGVEVAALATAKLPKLERLSVWLGGRSSVCVDDVYSPDEWDEDNEDGLRYPATFDDGDLEGMDPHTSGIECEVNADDLAPLLAARFSPALTRFEIGAPQWTPELLAAVFASPMAKQVDTLVIAGGTLGDAAAKSLPKKLRDGLSLVVTSQMSDALAKKLKALPRVSAFPVEEEEEFHFRYVATVE